MPKQYQWSVRGKMAPMVLLLSWFLFSTVKAAHVQIGNQGNVCFGEGADEVICKDGDMGTYQDCGNEPCCSEYCQCFLGTAWNYTCAPNIWDNQVKACKEPWEVPACGVTTEPPTEPPPSTPKSNECSDKWNPCPKDENGNDISDTYPEGPCESYFCLCHMGYGLRRECQPDTFYDEKYKACSYPWDVAGCNPTTTSTFNIFPFSPLLTTSTTIIIPSN